MTVNKLAPLIEQQLPSYVHDQYPIFVSFITAYFEWLDEEGNYANFLNSYKENIDIDRSNDEYVTQFLQEFAGGIPAFDLKIPKNDLVKLIKEFYIAKGTEDSFKFIFRILYDKDVSVYYPRELIFATSDNTYDGDYLMSIVQLPNKEYFINDDSVIYITDNTSGYKAIVDELIEQIDIGGNRYFKAYLSSFDDGLIDQTNMDLKLDIDGIVYNTSVVQAINDIDIDDGGRGYDVGNTIYIELDQVNLNNGMVAKVTAVTRGGIETITIVDGGDNYVAGDLIAVESNIDTVGYGFSGIVREVDVNGTITKVEVVSKGYNFENEQVGKITTNYSEVEPTTQAVFTLSGSKLGSIKRIQIKDGGHIHTPSEITLLDDGGIGAVLTPIFANIFETPKYTLNQKGFTSYNNVLTDSWYYQQFSYLVSSYEPPNQWKYVVNKILHPAGLVQFNNWLYESEDDIGLIGFSGSDSTLSLVILIISEAIQTFLIGVDNETIHMQYVDVPQTETPSHNLRDLDSEKLLENFTYPISDFYDLSINDILGGQDVEFNYINETYIVQTYSSFTASQGTYTMTGNDVILSSGLPVLPIVQGSYIQTGNDAILSEYYPPLVIVKGSYIQTGKDVILNEDSALAIAQGSFIMDASNVTELIKDSRTTEIVQGTYLQTGIDAVLVKTMSVIPGSYIQSGNDYTILKDSRTTEIVKSSFLQSGNDVGVFYDIPIVKGSYLLDDTLVTILSKA